MGIFTEFPRKIFQFWFKSDKCHFTFRTFPHSQLQGEVNSVKNATMNIWLNDGVY